MVRPLIDLLWRDHPQAPRGGTRGPRSRTDTGDVVRRAIALADVDGLQAVTVRAVAQSLGIATMSVYTHVNSRDDLLVLMADDVHAGMDLPTYGRAGWRTRVRRVAEANLGLLLEHRWLVEIVDERTALGPGTIRKYDHELQALDGTGLKDVDRDAALTFVLDFVRASARARLPVRPTPEVGAAWSESAQRLAAYLGGDYPTAQRVGQAAGEEMAGPSSPGHAWTFGLARVIDGLAAVAEG